MQSRILIYVVVSMMVPLFSYITSFSIKKLPGNKVDKFIPRPIRPKQCYLFFRWWSDNGFVFYWKYSCSGLMYRSSRRKPLFFCIINKVTQNSQNIEYTSAKKVFHPTSFWNQVSNIELFVRRTSGKSFFSRVHTEKLHAKWFTLLCVEKSVERQPGEK